MIVVNNLGSWLGKATSPRWCMPNGMAAPWSIWSSAFRLYCRRPTFSFFPSQNARPETACARLPAYLHPHRGALRPGSGDRVSLRLALSGYLPTGGDPEEHLVHFPLAAAHSDVYSFSLPTSDSRGAAANGPGLSGGRSPLSSTPAGASGAAGRRPAPLVLGPHEPYRLPPGAGARPGRLHRPRHLRRGPPVACIRKPGTPRAC